MIRRDFSLPPEPVPAGLLPSSFRRTKVLLHKGGPSQHPNQLPSRLQPGRLTMASFRATSASVKHDTSPATEKLQFIKPGIRRKSRRRLHRGEGTKEEKCFIPKPRPQEAKKDPHPSEWAGEPEQGLL